MPEFVKAIKKSELPPETGTTVEIGGKRVAIFNAGGVFYAMDDTCPHEGGPLGEGDVSGAFVTCPWHAWEFNIMTGENDEDPDIRVDTYEVRIEGDDVLVKV